MWGNPAYLRWWAAIGATAVGILLITLVGEQGTLPIAPLNQLHDGRLVAADYWSEEPLILSAGLGFDNIVGLPDVTEETVREAGGSWYGSVTCTNGEEPSLGHRTSTTLSNSRRTVLQRLLPNTMMACRLSLAGRLQPKRWISLISSSR